MCAHMIELIRMEREQRRVASTWFLSKFLTREFGHVSHVAITCAKKHARLILSSGPIVFWQDKAPGHRAKKTLALLDKLFTEVVNQLGKSPDTSMLDAGVFPRMEREVDDRGCTSKADIHKAVKYIWRTPSPETLARASQPRQHHPYEGRQLLR
jgi:hypothetical protein